MSEPGDSMIHPYKTILRNIGVFQDDRYEFWLFRSPTDSLLQRTYCSWGSLWVCRCLQRKYSSLCGCKLLNGTCWDFPGGAVVKNPPSNAGDMGSSPGWGIKIPHAMGQRSPRTATTELPCCKLQSPRALESSCCNEELACRNKKKDSTCLN